jgi:hypothetical protein
VGVEALLVHCPIQRSSPTTHPLQINRHQHQRYPHALMNLPPDLGTSACAVKVSDDGGQREQYANQRHQHRGHDRSGDADRGKGYGRQPPGHRGVDHSIRHHRKLRDQNWPGQMDELRGGGSGAFHISVLRRC